MRVLLSVVLLSAAIAPAFAGVAVDPNGPWPDRINTCVALWYDATKVEQGTMSYRQFITKCVGGRTAAPIKTNALCVDGTSGTGHTPGGACADNAGVAQWLN
ncbi:MAG TPA: hypothetical protein VLV55_01885 [Rhizomicrobium sp.]|nr:hypothetical protein [Rhizomicrobium sp.]